MLIDCETCVVRDIACDDCVVGVLLAGPDEDATLNSAERAAIGVLARSGLVPPLRLVQDPHAQTTDGSSDAVRQRAKRQVDGASYRPTYRPMGDVESA